MKDSTDGGRVKERRALVCPQRYLNDSDLGPIDVPPGGQAFSQAFFVEGFLDATLQAFDTSGGTGSPFIELAVQVANDTEGFVGGPVLQVIAGAGWWPVGGWTQVTWSWARVRPMGRKVRLRFRSTSGVVLDDVTPSLRLLMRGVPSRARLKVNA